MLSTPIRTITCLPLNSSSNCQFSIYHPRYEFIYYLWTNMSKNYCYYLYVNSVEKSYQIWKFLYYFSNKLILNWLTVSIKLVVLIVIRLFVGQSGFEPPTPRSSIWCSTNWATDPNCINISYTAMLIRLLFYSAKIHTIFDIKKLYSKIFQEILIIVSFSIARLIQRISIISLS